MRIGVDARLADYTVGGIARYTTQLVSAEMALGQDHSIITIRSRSPKVNPPTIPSSETLLARTPPHHRIERFSLPWELRNARLDVLHSPDCIPPRPGRWASVITVHDLAFLRMPRLLTEESRRYYGEIRRAVQEAKAIIAVSQVTADDLVRLAGARPEKVHVVHEAADSEMQPMPRDTAKSLVGDRFAIAAPYVLFVGTLEPRKNIPGLIQAFGHLRKDFPVRLVLAGRNGWLSEEIFMTVRSQALEDGVSFLGEVSPEELRTLYCAAEVLVLPSLYEGFGLPAVEAMACGTPVVVANTGALPEIVGEAGVLVRPDDPLDIAEALGWVLGNPGYREVLSARGIERAATFSWERAARETMAIYEQVAGG
ncbi:MAG: glycosyltransferase family 1 protein [Chloroflexi bacterium]|nr:glycosyltransferase family 1 protein [Chloroflexota bacterium]